MPENYWSEQGSESDFAPIDSLMGVIRDPEEEEEEFRSEFFEGLAGRRRKAATVLTIMIALVMGLHSVSWGYWFVTGLTILLLCQAAYLIGSTPSASPPPLTDADLANAPSFSLLVAAKNEEAVIGNLVRMLCNLDYPADKYEVWIVDDHSTDKTPAILDNLAQEYPQLNILHRPAGGTGGKSGALNQVFPLTKGEIIAVFDADAGVTPDLLRSVVPLFAAPDMGGVQVRKAIANQPLNFWTKGQATEMALDGYFQQQRIAIGGIGELRGNGQFVRRLALKRCGGWNEETITDDLDLTIRLHVDNWQIGYLPFPAVNEEGVKTPVALWHQRSRWAEGGYQRYLDYWRLLLGDRLKTGKKIDLWSFVLIQYILPTIAIPDMIIAAIWGHFPILTPLSGLMFGMSFWAMFNGLRRLESKIGWSEILTLSWLTLRGMIYMLHWLLVMPITIFRMSVRPKRLKWVKTVHEGTDN
jgi:1,2-diacylglycerol 3-beta-glucosyltransferase